ITTRTVTASSPNPLTVPLTILTTALGDHAVSVTTGGGTSNTLPFTVAAAAPTLTQISPSYEFVSSAPNPVAVTLTGTNFIPGVTTVAVDPPSDITVGLGTVTSTSINAIFTINPGAATGPRSVTVSTTAGGTGNAVTFTIFGPPTLTNISASSGQRSTNPTIPPTGSQFVAGSTMVTVAGRGAATT